MKPCFFVWNAGGQKKGLPRRIGCVQNWEQQLTDLRKSAYDKAETTTKCVTLWTLRHLEWKSHEFVQALWLVKTVLPLAQSHGTICLGFTYDVFAVNINLHPSQRKKMPWPPIFPMSKIQCGQTNPPGPKLTGGPKTTRCPNLQHGL